MSGYYIILVVISHCPRIVASYLLNSGTTWEELGLSLRLVHARGVEYMSLGRVLLTLRPISLL
jgi:hypothetical protein